MRSMQIVFLLMFVLEVNVYAQENRAERSSVYVQRSLVEEKKLLEKLASHGLERTSAIKLYNNNNQMVYGLKDKVTGEVLLATEHVHFRFLDVDIDDDLIDVAKIVGSLRAEKMGVRNDYVSGVFSLKQRKMVIPEEFDNVTFALGFKNIFITTGNNTGFMGLWGSEDGEFREILPAVTRKIELNGVDSFQYLLPVWEKDEYNRDIEVGYWHIVTIPHAIRFTPTERTRNRFASLSSCESSVIAAD